MGIEPFEPVKTSLTPQYGKKPSAMMDAPPPEVSLAGAAFRQENPVVNAIQWMARPEFQADPAFDLKARLTAAPDDVQFADALVEIESDAEYDFVIQKAREEMRDQQRLAAAGWAGFGMAMVAGVLSPTILLPGGAIKSGTSVGRAALNTASWGAVAASLDEGVLHGNQQLRTTQESLGAIAFETVLAGIIGGSIKYLSKGERAAIEAGMVEPQNNTTIRPDAAPSANGAAEAYPDPTPQGIGAQAVDVPYDPTPDPGSLATLKVGIGKFKADLAKGAHFLSPVNRTLQQQTSKAARWMQAQLSVGGQYLEKNIDGQIGAGAGEIEQLVKQYPAHFYKVKEVERGIWQDYLDKTPPGSRMNRKQFDEDAGLALISPESASSDQARALADAYRNEVYLPILKEAKDAGLLGDLSPEEAMTYFPRSVRKGMAIQDFDEMQSVLEEHFQEVFMQEARTIAERGLRKIDKAKEAAEDLSLDAAGVAAKRDELEIQIKDLPNQHPPAVQAIAEEVRDLRAQARISGRDEAKTLRARAKALETDNKELLKGFRTDERKLKSRFSRLNKTRAGFAEQQTRALEMLERIEESQVKTLLAVQKRIQRVIDKATKVETGRVEGTEKLSAQIKKGFGVWAREEAKLDKLRGLPDDFAELSHSDIRPTDRISKLEARQALRKEAMVELEERLATLSDLDPAQLAKELEDLKVLFAKKANDVNGKRAIRADKLQQRVESLTPERQAELSGAAKADLSNARLGVVNALKEKDFGVTKRPSGAGADSIFFDGSDDILNNISVKAQAELVADEIANKLVGNHGRISMSGLIETRGPEFARKLNIDPLRVWSNGRRYVDFLEMEAEKVTRRYIRTMAPDIELKRRFGSVNPLAEGSTIRADIRKDFLEAKKAAKTPEEGLAIDAQERQVFRDLEAQIDRLRHTRGVPDDASGLAYRAGRAALNINTLRLMGGVVVSSIPDMARPIMKHGLLNTFRHGFLPLVTDLKRIKMSAREARYAGTSLDLVIHGRSSDLFDIFDEIENGTMFERGLQWSTNNFGRVSGFDYWNVGMKNFSSSVGMGRIMGALEDLDAGKASRGDIAYLASLNIDEGAARAILREVKETPGGGTSVNGTLMPNTESWANPQTRRLFRAALAKTIDDTIITPGLERPLWMDANMTARLVAQFRSFTYSSTMKVMVAGAQDVRVGNMAPVLNGAMFSLALGALSYYTWATARGGKAREEMLNADASKWADEAILRSGLIGVIGEVQRIAERTPGVGKYATLSGKPSSRSPFNQPFTDALGPTLGLLKDAERIVMTSHDPNSETFRRGRNLLPLQNHTALARLFKMVEEATAEQFE